jgi:hypothetical protein
VPSRNRAHIHRGHTHLESPEVTPDCVLELGHGQLGQLVCLGGPSGRRADGAVDLARQHLAGFGGSESVAAGREEDCVRDGSWARKRTLVWWLGAGDGSERATSEKVGLMKGRPTRVKPAFAAPDLTRASGALPLTA